MATTEFVGLMTIPEASTSVDKGRSDLVTPASLSGLFSHGAAMDVEKGASGRQTGASVI